LRAFVVGFVVVTAACGRMGFDAQGMGAAADASDAPGTDAFVAPVPGCIAGETPGPFTSDFEMGVPSFGSIYELGAAQMDVFQGQLRGQPVMAPGANVYAGFETTVADYRERRAFAQIPTMVNTATCAQVSFNIQDDDIVQYVELTQDCGQLHAYLWVGATPTVLADVTYNPTLHRWWQVRAHAGTLTFEVSADGIGWTQLATTATPAYFDDAYLELSAGTYQMESLPVGEARFDDLFDCFAQ
jgi:hypothetical protein